MFSKWFFRSNKKSKEKRIFLDYASATPLRDEVRQIMDTYNRVHFANPNALYSEAREAKEALEKARGQVGSFLNCAKERVVFTSGGTEGNNIALLGTFEYAKKHIDKPHIISVVTEHSSVREVLEEITRRGGEVTLLKPDTEGLVSVEQVTQAITENTVLVSIMYVNNEIGAVQPIKEIGQAIKKYRAEKNKNYPLLHTDACQAPLFYSLDVSTLGVDMLTLDGLKCYGPRNVGALFVGHDVKISPIMFGGGQEGGLRSGTEHVAGAIGLAKALILAKAERKELSERLETLRDYFIEELLKIPGTKLNASRKHRIPNNVNICFENTDAEYLVVTLDTYGVSVSYSSSCLTLKEDSSSYVIEAINPQCKDSSIRFTLGRETTKKDIDGVLATLHKALVQVKK